MYKQNWHGQNYVFNCNRKPTFQMNRDYAIQIINHYAKMIPYSEQCPNLGKSIGSHALRRTYASTLFKKSIQEGRSKEESILRVQKCLGHRNPKVMWDYIFASNEAE